MNSPLLSDDDPDYFLKWWIWVQSSLSTLLDFESNKQNPKFPLEKMMLWAKADYESGNKSGAISLGHIHDFVVDMEFLKTNKPALFKSFRNKFLSGPGKQFEYLTGTWFEVKIARLFLDKEFDFRCPVPDPPDFEVLIDNQTISIECYSPRLEQGASIYPQLLKAIESRKVKKYRNQGWINGLSVLFLEGTWVLRSQVDGILGSNYSLSSEMLNTLSELKKNSSYDLVVLLTFGRLTSSGQNGSTISCVYTPTKISDPYLATFIKTLLGNFNEESEINILLPNLPRESET